jgi:hypothetical protein
VEGVEDDAQQLKVMRRGKKGNDREELTSLISGATVSEERRIMECVVSCVFSASDSVFRDKSVVSI